MHDLKPSQDCKAGHFTLARMFMNCSLAQEQLEPAKKEAVLSLLPAAERERVEHEMAQGAAEAENTAQQ